MIKITIDMVKKLRNLTSIGVVECKKALVEAKGNIDCAIDNIRKSGLIKNAKRILDVTIEGIILVKVLRNNKYGVILELNCETDFVAKNDLFKDFGNRIINTAITECIVDLDLLRVRFEEECNILMNKFDENIKIGQFITMQGDKLSCYLHGVRVGVLVDGTSITDELLKSVAMHIVASNPKYIGPDNIPNEVIDHEYEIQKAVAVQLSKSIDISNRIVSGRMEKFVNSISLLHQPFIMNESNTVGQLLKMHGARINNFVRLEIGENTKI